MDVFHCYSVVDVDTGATSSTEWHASPITSPPIGTMFEFLNGATVMAGYVHETATIVKVEYNPTGTTRTSQRTIHVVRIGRTSPP